MSGFFRLLLALMVVVAHLAPSPRGALWGGCAVYSFYLLSGYLITLVLHETYGFTLSGGGRFLANRVLRLYPTYYCVCLFSLGVLLLCGDAGRAFLPRLRLPDSPSNILSHLFLVPFVVPSLRDGVPRLAPPCWSLAVELVCYALLWLWIARSRRHAILTLLAALTCGAILIARRTDLGTLYMSVSSALIPFSLGALAWFTRDQVFAWCGPRWQTTVVALYASNLLLAPLLLGRIPWPFALNVLLSFFVVLFVSHCRLPAPRFRRCEAWAGKLSYPIFLIHWPVALVVHHYAPGGPSRSWVLLAATLPPLFGLSYLLVRYVEEPIEQWRNRIRSGTGAQPQVARPVRRAA
jgi:peptidoglycan/LPS O-acetylase OafA/YrhL